MADDQGGGHQSDPRNWLLPDDPDELDERHEPLDPLDERLEDEHVLPPVADDRAGHRVDPADRRRGGAAAALRPGRHRARCRTGRRRPRARCRRSSPTGRGGPRRGPASSPGPGLARRPRRRAWHGRGGVRPRLAGHRAEGRGPRRAPGAARPVLRRRGRGRRGGALVPAAAHRRARPVARHPDPHPPPGTRRRPGRARPRRPAGESQSFTDTRGTDGPEHAGGHRRRRRPGRAVPPPGQARRQVPHGARRAGAGRGGRRVLRQGARAGLPAGHARRASSPSPACRWPPTGGATAACRSCSSWPWRPRCVWYMLSGGLESNPAPNTAITLLGVTWIGLLGAYAALDPAPAARRGDARDRRRRHGRLRRRRAVRRLGRPARRRWPPGSARTRPSKAWSAGCSPPSWPWCSCTSPACSPGTRS